MEEDFTQVSSSAFSLCLLKTTMNRSVEVQYSLGLLGFTVVVAPSGANVIPMENLEGRMSGEAHRIMVRSAADAGTDGVAAIPK